MSGGLKLRCISVLRIIWTWAGLTLLPWGASLLSEIWGLLPWVITPGFLCILSSVSSSQGFCFGFYYCVFLFCFFFYSYFIYLFILFLAVLGLRFVRGLSPATASGGHSSSRCGDRSSSRCGDRSSSRCAGLSLSRPLPLRGTGSRRAGSVVVAHGPSCSVACGIFPDQSSNPCPLH